VGPLDGKEYAAKRGGGGRVNKQIAAQAKKNLVAKRAEPAQRSAQHRQNNRR